MNYKMGKKVYAAPVRITRPKATTPKLSATPKFKPPFPDLLDTSKRVALLQKYTPFFESFYTAPQLAGYLSAAVATFFNDRRIYRASQDLKVSKNGNKPDKDYEAFCSGLIKKCVGTGTFAPKMRITDNNVVLYTNPVEMEFVMTLPGPQNRDERQALTTYLKQLFPAFNPPQAWEFSPQSDPPISFILGNDEITTGWRSFDTFKNALKLDDATNFSYVPELDFKGLNSDMSQAAYASLFGIVTLNSISSYDKYSLGIEGNAPTTGPLQVALGSAQVSVTVQAQIRVPLEMALWMTLQTMPDQFNPKVFHEFAGEQMANLNGITKIKDFPKQTMTLKNIHESNTSRMTEYGFNPKPRVNEDNLLISATGKIWYIPTVNNTAQYDTLQKSAFDPETGELTPTHRIEGMKNMPVYTDLVNEVFSYTGADGNIQNERLTGAMPLDSITIAKYLKRTPADLFGVTDPNKVEYESNAAAISENLFSILDKVIQDGNGQGLKLMAENPAGYSSVSTLWMLISQTNDTVANLFSFKDENSNEHSKGSIVAFIQTMKNCLSFLDKQSRFGVSTLLEIRFWLIFFTKYATHPGPYLEHWNDNIQKNVPARVMELPTSIDIPNLGSGVAVLPHQLQGVAQSEKGPELLIFDSSPGGGKTAQSIFDILIQKVRQRVGSAVVVCPPILVKEWTSEINKFGQGKINAIPLTAKVVSRLRRRMDINRQQFLDYCNSAPPNTIFVVSMKFLSLKSDKFAPDNKSRFDVRYGKTVIRQYPQVWFIRQLNPDYIVIDESHYGKNLKSQTTEVIKQIASFAKYRRLSSGTLVTNQGDDLVGQASILNPAIYGDKTKFYDKYAITGGRGGAKFESFKPGAELTIRQDSLPYTSWITKRRADWSFLLPEINTQFWRTDMTENQSKFYEDLLSEAIEEIKKDKKIQKLMEEEDPDIQDSIEEKMKLYLAKIEIFLNAPDSEKLPFNSLSYVEPADLISSKVKLCEQICRAHFNGGSIPGYEEIPFQKEQSKIIIFAYNKEVIDHFKRHFNPGLKVVFYQAGDDDAILKFRQNTPDSPKILVAAETSLREGLNLQVASRLIRLQTLWSPGNQEQAVSRVMRPDVANAYSRKEINYDWMVCNNSFEVAKTCRLVSKIVSNLTITEGSDPAFLSFSKQFKMDELELIRMSIENIREYASFERIEAYSDAWSSYQTYEKNQFDLRKEELRGLVAKKLGIPKDEVTEDVLKANAFTKVISKSTIPGSKSIWVPLEQGAIPYDPFQLDLKPVAVLEQKTTSESDEGDEDEDEDKEELVEQAPVNVGDMVYTEYGIGYIKTILTKVVKVDIPGVPFSPVTINKSLVFKPTHEENAAKVAKLMKQQGSKGLSFMKGFDVVPTPTSTPNLQVNKSKVAMPIVKPVKAPVRPVPPTPEPEEDEEEIDNKKIKVGDRMPGKTNMQFPVELDAGVFDGYPSVYLFANQENLDKIMKHNPVVWRQYPQFIYRHVKTWQGLKNLATELENSFTLLPDTIPQLMNAGTKLYHKGNPQLVQRTQQNMDFRSFLNVGTHSVAKDPSLIKVYPMIMNGQLYVVGATANQPRQMQTFRKLNIQGLGPVQVHEPMHLAMFKTPLGARKYMRDLKHNFNVPGINAALKFIRTAPQTFFKL